MMKVYHEIDGFEKLSNAVVTIGTFDGVHIGHQIILERIKEISDSINGETVLITFWPHPRFVINPGSNKFHLLSSIEEKTEILKNYHIDHLVIIPFTREFSNMSSEEFIRDILVDRIGIRKLVIGYDHKFGKDRKGSFEELKKDAPLYGFEVEEIPEQDIDNIAVSSTKIRKALESGDIETANKYLNRNYNIGGYVVKGDSLGRKIGFPTANIKVEFKQKLIPSDGIYAVRVKCQNKYYDGMLNIGYRPTVSGKNRVIEANIFDFDNDIYGEYVEIYFFQKTRDEKKFSSLEELKNQLSRDREEIKQLLKKHI